MEMHGIGAGKSPTPSPPFGFEKGYHGPGHRRPGRGATQPVVVGVEINGSSVGMKAQSLARASHQAMGVASTKQMKPGSAKSVVRRPQAADARQHARQRWCNQTVASYDPQRLIDPPRRHHRVRRNEGDQILRFPAIEKSDEGRGRYLCRMRRRCIKRRKSRKSGNRPRRPRSDGSGHAKGNR